MLLSMDSIGVGVHEAGGDPEYCGSIKILVRRFPGNPRPMLRRCSW